MDRICVGEHTVQSRHLGGLGEHHECLCIVHLQKHFQMDSCPRLAAKTRSGLVICTGAATARITSWRTSWRGCATADTTGATTATTTTGRGPATGPARQ